MKSFILGCLIAVSSFSAVNAQNSLDSHDLSQHGDWTVSINYNRSTKNLFCSVSTVGDLSGLTFTVFPDASYMMVLIIDVGPVAATIDEPLTQDLPIRLGDNGYMLNDVDVFPIGPTTVTFAFAFETENAGIKMMEGIKQAQEFRIVRKNQDDLVWSFPHSHAGIDSFDACKDKIVISY